MYFFKSLQFSHINIHNCLSNVPFDNKRVGSNKREKNKMHGRRRRFATFACLAQTVRAIQLNRELRTQMSNTSKSVIYRVGQKTGPQTHDDNSVNS